MVNCHPLRVRWRELSISPCLHRRDYRIIYSIHLQEDPRLLTEPFSLVHRRSFKAMRISMVELELDSPYLFFKSSQAVGIVYACNLHQRYHCTAVSRCRSALELVIKRRQGVGEICLKPRHCDHVVTSLRKREDLNSDAVNPSFQRHAWLLIISYPLFMETYASGLGGVNRGL